MLAFGIVIPVLPKLVLDFTGGSATSAAWWQGVFGTVFAVIQFFFAPVLGALSDMGAGLASFALYGTAWSQWVVFAAIALGGFWGVWSAAAQTILSKTVAATEQGRLQGALASVRAACQVFTPAIFNGAFALSVRVDAHWAGAPMLVSAALLALAVPFAAAATRDVGDTHSESAIAAIRASIRARNSGQSSRITEK